ncbi:MAG: hypothetical protein KHY62_01450 [Firmicutes bacterium]|nr:hypothetical protein [Bacillota bacterium]
MSYGADFLIKRRKEKWEETKSIDYDKKLKSAIADEIIKNEVLREEIKARPEKLIELEFVVVDKEQITMPFFFNEVQKDFLSVLNKAIEEFNSGMRPDISILILKGRQQGFTTLVTAYQLAMSILNKNFQGFTLADVSDNSEAIFQNKAKFPYMQLPEVLKPTEKFNNRRQLLFEKLNSSWEVDTATKDVGRSRTISFFHGSECAFWQQGIAPIQAGLGQAFTKNCIKVYESTANGYNDYQAMWESGAHINCFYEWWRTPEYRLEFPNEKEKERFIKDIEEKEGWIYERLRWLLNVKKIEPEAARWYFRKYEEIIDKRLIRQEYPCTPEEAFLLSGDTVFDTEKLTARLQTVKKPIKTGYFDYDYDGIKISRIRWVNDRNGYIKIYQVPNSPEITKYCIGGDTAGDGSDWFTGHVLNAKTGEQAAVLKHRFDADQYTRQMYCLGKYYKNALIGIEANFDTYPIRELQRLGYNNQYVREAQDYFTGKMEKRFGFKTTVLTRPTIISRLVEIVREHVERINDEDTLKELLTIVRNEKGKIEAPEGRHDDQMMGLAIAHEIKGQVTFDKDEIRVRPEYQFDFEKKEENYDYGEEIVIV